MAWVAFSLMQAQGRVRAVAIVHIVEAPLMVGSLWIGVHWWGLSGAAWAVAIREVLDSLVFLSLAGLLASTVTRIIPAALFVIAAIMLAKESSTFRLTGGPLLVAGAVLWAFRMEPGLWALVFHRGQISPSAVQS
jgi:O-antigen/teichoic acid export membrane protein